MPRPKGIFKEPEYKLHGPSGCAYTRINGEQIWLGKHATAESRAKFDRLMAQFYQERGRTPSIDGDKTVRQQTITVAELIHAWVNWTRTYYGGPRNNAENRARPVFARLRTLYGDTPASTFGQKRLKEFREHLIKCEDARRPGVTLSRRYVNNCVKMVRGMFRWADEEELVTPGLYHALCSVRRLKKNRTDAREKAKVKPARAEDIGAALPFMLAHVRAMVRLQLLSGARPGEVAQLRGCDIDTSKQPWEFRPATHKTAYREHDRVVFFDADAQQVIKEWLPLSPTAYLFRPVEAAREHYQRRRKCGLRRPSRPLAYAYPSRYALAKDLDVSPWCARHWVKHAVGCPVSRTGPWTGRDALKLYEWAKRKLDGQIQPNKPYRAHYSAATYGAAIKRACDKADQWAKGGKVIGNDERVVRRFHPHQLRHNAATDFNRRFGWDVARILLGHHSVEMTAVYAEEDLDKARHAILRVG